MKAIHKYNNSNKYRGKTISDREKQRRILQSLQAQHGTAFRAVRPGSQPQPHAPMFADTETIKL